MRALTEPISLDELEHIAENSVGNLVKAVVDIGRGVIALDAELHSDLEAFLLNAGSLQKDLWGINLYPQFAEDDFIEFDSMINLRPSQGNLSRGVEDYNIRQLIISEVNKWIIR